MGERSVYERRRREFRERAPTHHCIRCTSVLYQEDEACLECGAEQPELGWPELGRTTDPWLGRALADRYLLTRRIGHGASGNVYRAESLTIARQFAVKIIPLENKSGSISSEHIEARLHREIGALGHLRNPHIVSFYDVVPLGGRAVALLMDLIDGRTLESTVSDGGPVDILRASKILRQIANGVHEAHEAGMIHRDLKPENIMIERLPAGDDFVHILDFGIVWREGDVRVTQGFLGTPLYASPEQAVGGELDRRADIYALGGVFFFMLTGKPPFYDDNVYNVLKAHVGTKPPTLSEAAGGREFPAEVEELVARMLSKSPTDRPQTLSGVIGLLDKLIRHLSESKSKSKRSTSAGDSIDLQPTNSTGGPADPHRTVQSEASLVEASRPQPQGKSSGESASESDAREAEARERREESGFFRSDEWDSTGPKAAILRGRTPAGPVSAVDRGGVDASSPIDELGLETPSAASFADAEAARRDSGLYEMPRLATELTEKGLRCAAATSQQLVFVDAAHRVLIGGADQRFEPKFELPDEPELTAISLLDGSIVTGHADGTVARWSIADADQTNRRTKLHQNASTSPVRSLDCDANGRWLLFGTDAGGLYLAERQEDGELRPLRIQSGPRVHAVALSATRDVFAVARADNSVSLFGISSPTSLLHCFRADDRIERMAFSKDGYLLAVVFAEKKLALYHAMTGKLVMQNDQMLEQPLSISFDDNNQLVGYCEVEGRVFGWDLHHNLVPHRQK